jgi:hypothetical protein
VQHGLRVNTVTGEATLDPDDAGVALQREDGGTKKNLRALRPPLVVRLRKGAPAELVRLGVDRFPEGML